MVADRCEFADIFESNYCVGVILLFGEVNMTDKKETLSDVEKQRQELMARLKGAQSQMQSSGAEKSNASGFLDVMIKSTGTFEKQ